MNIAGCNLVDVARSLVSSSSYCIKSIGIGTAHRFIGVSHLLPIGCFHLSRDRNQMENVLEGMVGQRVTGIVDDCNTSNNHTGSKKILNGSIKLTNLFLCLK